MTLFVRNSDQGQAIRPRRDALFGLELPRDAKKLTSEREISSLLLASLASSSQKPPSRSGAASTNVRTRRGGRYPT